MAIRAASIWRSVIQAASSVFNPYSPKLIALPRVATPVMRPRICLRCLTFFGINMAFSQFTLFSVAVASFQSSELKTENLKLKTQPTLAAFLCADEAGRDLRADAV